VSDSKKHPWRDPAGEIAKTRSRSFAAYLTTLPDDERERIVAAERTYLYSDKSHPAFRIFSENMVGVREDVPVAYRGFIV
jgi:hypothetical protein